MIRSPLIMQQNRISNFTPIRRSASHLCLFCRSGLGLSVGLSLLVAECENLVRRMLALKPSRRCAISDIRHHPWLTAGGGRNTKCLHQCWAPFAWKYNVHQYNEQILQIMKSLGIDQLMTLQVSWGCSCFPRCRFYAASRVAGYS